MDGCVNVAEHLLTSEYWSTAREDQERRGGPGVSRELPEGDDAPNRRPHLSPAHHLVICITLLLFILIIIITIIITK